MAFVGVSAFGGKVVESRCSAKCPRGVRMQVGGALTPQSGASVVADDGDKALRDFRMAVIKERSEQLAGLRQSLQARKAQWDEGLPQSKLLTFAGQLEVEYARLQRWKRYPGYNLAGEIQTGTDTSIGAMDYQDTSIIV